MLAHTSSNECNLLATMHAFLDNYSTSIDFEVVPPYHVHRVYQAVNGEEHEREDEVQAETHVHNRSQEGTRQAKIAERG